MIRTFDLKTSYRPIKRLDSNQYMISWDYKEHLNPIEKENEETEYTDSIYASWVSKVLYLPTIQAIKDIILAYYNEQIDNKILSGFEWNGYKVWLSSENQFNYKAAYDLAVQTQGASLPVTFKFGSDTEPQYHIFTTLEDLHNFYTSAISYINTTLAEGWQIKDSIDWSKYEIK